MSPDGSRPGDLWIRDYGPWRGGGGTRLLCFPHAGGSATFYRPLATLLGGDDDPEVLGVQYPGRQDRYAEPPLTGIGELADHILPELKPLTDRPLVLFGHSMGAVLAYETARRMERDTGVPPLGVIASGRRAPSVPVTENLHRRGDRALIEEVRTLSGTADGVLDDPEMRELILPSLRADYRAVETYRHLPGRELSCPLLVLAGSEDPRAPLDQVRLWDRHTTGSFALRVLPGGHFYLSTQWAAVAEAVRSGIAAFRGRAGAAPDGSGAGPRPDPAAPRGPGGRGPAPGR
ncbi:thioesterase II family protein [Streptomyces aidingensis]|uniref:Surfactin synthase thioesterase subunit n=1 Tax=Streptomyces aidingensis TaxID=910347 RepID=A0A1I1T5P5_9ACTN|nr:alpha/beta fold hydrolase [Streptomyces aidingensis]SFD53929.1 Surfactin synthase thioesterase subunit [Streptomyces aidingensis]